MEKLNRTLLISSGCFLVALIFEIVGYNEIFKCIVKDQASLRKGNRLRDAYLDIPVPLHFCVNFFHVTNPSEAQIGMIPSLKEVGPYCYDVYIKKVDVVDDESEDSLTYTPSETFFFNQNKSGDLTEEDYVTILDPIIVGMINTVGEISPILYDIVNSVISPLFNNPDSIYLTAKVKDILFDGLPINCSSSSLKFICAQMKAKLPGVKTEDDGILKYGILSAMNGTLSERIKVLRGIRSTSDLGRIIEINNQTELKIWGGEKCNQLKGTDGWIVPPFLDKDKGIWVHPSNLCRNMHLKYVRDIKRHGVKIQEYYADLGDMQADPDDKCYCTKTCLPKGVLNLKNCLGAPMYVTLPHFLRADENLLKQVEGLSPITDKHIIKVLLEQRLAVPFEVRIRAQANLQVGPIPAIDLMANFSEALHPIFWFELGFALEGSILSTIKFFYLGLDIIDVLRYSLLIASIVCMAYGGYLQYRARGSLKITPIGAVIEKIGDINPSSKIVDKKIP